MTDDLEYLREELLAAKLLLARFQGIHEATVKVAPEPVTDVQHKLYLDAGKCIRRPIYSRGEAA